MLWLIDFQQVQKNNSRSKLMERIKLSEAARICRNKYLKIWRKNHPENIREAQRKFWEHRAEKEALNEEKSKQV
jgi:hypothetical protein